MEYYWICLRTDTTAGLYKVKPNEIVSYEDFEYIKNECGMQYAETVTFTFKDMRYMMLVDEEGKLNGKEWNRIADLLYSSPFDEIVGDVAILKYSTDSEMRYMSKEEAYNIFDWLKNGVKRVTINANI